MSSSPKPAPVLDPDQAAAVGAAPVTTTTAAAVQPTDPDAPAAEHPATLKSTTEDTQDAGKFADKDEVSAPAAALDHEAHLHHAPKAEVAPERVTDLPGTKIMSPPPHLAIPSDPSNPSCRTWVGAKSRRFPSPSCTV